MTRRTTLLFRLLAMPLVLLAGTLMISSSGKAATGYSQYLRRYPYLTDVVNSYATINWGTDQSNSTGGVRYGKVGSESCTAHYVPGARTVVSVNTVAEYQWKAMLNLTPGTQYCYRVYLGSGPATEVDLLGTDASPVFWTQVPSGSNQSYTFDVFGDWGGLDATGSNTYQAKLMSLMAASGARFALTAGDNGYPSGNQTNYGDLVQTGTDISAIFGPSYWKVPGASLPIFAASGNHGVSNSDPNHPLILNFPQTKAAALSGGRYVKETYCCLDGTTSANYPSAWYAFDAGLARIYILDASWADLNIGTASSPYQVDYDYHWTTSSPEYQWLQADLASHPSLLKFAVLHYPIYSDDPHQTSDTYLQAAGGVEGLLKQYGVNMAFQGHSHTYQRFAASAAGIPNYVTGGGGAPLPLGAVGPCTALDLYGIGYTSKGYSCNAPKPSIPDVVYHFLKVTVTGTSLTVTPVNSLGNTFDIARYSVASSGDTTAPSVPAGLIATPASSGTEVDLAWSTSTDNQAVRGYDIYRDGTLITQTDATTLSFADTNLRPATGFSYTVDAFDGSGNHSAQSSSVGVTTPSAATYVFNPVADSYVAGDNTSAKFGTSVVLKADGSPDYHSYLRFNVNEIAGPVTKATLSLYTTFSSATGYQVNSVTNNQWDEGTLTYDNAPALGPVVGSSGKFSSGNWVSVDVTSLVNGNGIYDFGVSTTSTSSMSFNSRDAADNHPQLIIQTAATPPTPTATASLTPTITPTFSTASLTFTPSDDATINQSAATTNYGLAKTLDLSPSRPTEDFMLKFTVSGTSGLPVKSAKLRLYGVVSSNRGGDVHQVPSNTWTEGTVNWSTAPAYNSTVLASYGSVPANGWAEVDVSSLVKGDGTYSLRVVNTSQKGASYSSKEGSFTPQLVLSYTIIPTATSTPTITPTFTDTATPTPTDTPTSTPTATVTPTPNPSAAFSDGFESGNLSSWTSSAGLTIESSLVNGGSFAAQGNTTNGNTYAKKTLGTSYAEGYARIYFNLVSTSSQVNLLRYRSATDTSVAYLYVNTAGQLGLHNDTTAANILSTTTVSSGWHALVFHAIMNGAASTTEVWLDGVRVSDLSLTTDFGANVIGGLQIGDTQTARTYNVVFDDVVFDTQWIGLSGTVISTPTPTPTATLAATATYTPTDTATATYTATPSSTPTDTAAPTFTPTPGNTSTPTDTPLPTSTPSDTATPTLAPAPTDTPTPDPAGSATPTPTSTPTLAPVPTDTPTPTLGVLPTATNTPASTPTNTPTPAAPRVFSDGFESGTLNAWTTKGGLVVESTNVHGGIFAAEGNTTIGGTYAKKTLPSTYADGYARIYFNLVSVATNTQVNLLRFRPTASTLIGYVYVATNGTLGFHDDITNANFSSSTVVTTGWHSLELHATINGTASTTEVWLDGVKVNSLSITTDLGTSLIGSLQIGEVQSGRTYDVIFDDVVFDTQRIGP